jgi:hypothetical protein
MIFLASPYSHPDPAVREQRYVAACKAAAMLLRQGVDIVFSPIAHNHGIAIHGGLGLDADAWWEQSEAMLRVCDDVVVLMIPGWGESVGVQQEIRESRRFVCRVKYMDPETGTLSETPLDRTGGVASM